MLLALLAEGEFEGAELLLADDLVRAELDPNVVVMLETRVALAAASASDELAGSLAELAERAAEVGATVVICEADSCKGPVFDLPLVAVGSTRGDPTNVDVAAATAA